MSKIYTLLAESTDPTFDLSSLELPGGTNTLVIQASDGANNSEYSDEVEYVAEYENFVIDKSTVVAIADSVRGKTGKTDPILGKDISAKIDSIDLGIHPTGTASITSNGTHDVTNYAEANVNVPIPDGYLKPSRSVTVEKNGTYDASDWSSANVQVPQTTAALNELTIWSTISSAAQTYKPITCDGFSKVIVDLRTETLPAGTYKFESAVNWSDIPYTSESSILYSAPVTFYVNGTKYRDLTFIRERETIISFDANDNKYTLYELGSWNTMVSTYGISVTSGVTVPLGAFSFIIRNRSNQ